MIDFENVVFEKLVRFINKRTRNAIILNILCFILIKLALFHYSEMHVFNGVFENSSEYC